MDRARAVALAQRATAAFKKHDAHFASLSGTEHAEREAIRARARSAADLAFSLRAEIQAAGWATSTSRDGTVAITGRSDPCQRRGA